jgi:predicted dehydrogenase
VRVAVLGLGSIGLRHARNLLASGAEVVGFDPSPERRGLLEEAGGAAHAEREAALDGAQAVVIASPSGLHLGDLRVAVEAGLHALVEKPLAHTDQGLDELLAEAEAASLVVFPALNLRFHPAVEAAREVLAEGQLGQPLWARFLAASYLPGWRPHQDPSQGYAADPRSGGALFDFIHELDLAVHLLGAGETVAAAARCTGTVGLRTEDVADVILRHEGGVQSSVHVDYVTRPRRRFAEIAGTSGLLRLDLETYRVAVYGPHGEPGGEPAMERTFPRDSNHMYLAEARAFLDCVQSGAPPRCGAREALGVLRLVLRARRLAGLEVA